MFAGTGLEPLLRMSSHSVRRAGEAPLPGWLHRREPAGFDALTSREREILIEVAAGLSNAEIAAKLFLAEATVMTHVGRMLNKLRLRDRVQAVVYAYEHGPVRPGSRP
jgi:DNA-binding NarL/FixJ family response regulator